jgi:hypothetical protein
VNVDGSPKGGTGEVVSIQKHAAYRPDFKGLASGQVRAAREKLGLDHAGFAEYLGNLLGWHVTAAAVKRWEHGSTPPGDVLLACTAIGPTLDHAGDPSESVKPYADRGLISRQQWNGIIRGAESHLWLYGMAEFGYATDDEVPGIISAAADRGCRVRVLLLNPDFVGTHDIDADEGSPPGTLAARIRAALARYVQMRKACAQHVQLRTYDAYPTLSVVRGDNAMLVTPYLRFFIGNNSPTFELTEQSARKMFSRYARHFDRMWNLAKDWT